MKPRVLIVDDEPEVLDLVDFKLSGEGFEVIRAGTGVEGLQRARCESPDVILIDMMLPDLSGLALCEILRAQPATRDVPVVIFSALNRPKEKQKLARTRVVEWLNKGSDFHLLGDSLRAAMDRSG